MTHRFLLAGAALLALSVASSASAAVGVAPPAMYPANTWQGRTQAVIRVLDRLDAHIETLTIPVGGNASYRTLSVAVEACVSRPETLPADSGALLHLRDSGDSARPPFDGWMLQNEPSLGTYGSSLYDVRVVACTGDRVAPDAGPLPVIKAPQLAGTTATEDEGGTDQSGSSSSEGGAVPLAPDSHAPIPLAPPSGGAQYLVPPAPPASAGPSLPPPAADPGLE